MPTAATRRLRLHVDLRRQASALCRRPRPVQTSGMSEEWQHMSLSITTDPAVPRNGTLTDTARLLAANSRAWLARVRLSAEGRWYERLHRDADREIWLISWLPGQGTGLHDHGGSRGAFAVALGELEERDLDDHRTLGTGESRSFGADYVHEVRNASAAPAISVHVYSPPLTTMNRYELTPSGLVKVDAEEAGQW